MAEKKTKKVAAKATPKKSVKPAKPVKAVKEVKEVKKVKVVKAPGIDELSKQHVIDDFALKSGDTGSPEVQVAILTFKVVKLQQHLGQNPKDNHSRRGLLKIVSKRRRILNYLKEKDEGRFTGLEEKIKTFQQHYSA